MAYDDVNDVVDELLESLLSRYQTDFIFDFVQLLYYKCHKIYFKRGESNIDSHDWIKHKKSRLNPKSKDEKCFQYAAAIALNYREIKLNLKRVSNIEPLMNKSN